MEIALNAGGILRTSLFLPSVQAKVAVSGSLTIIGNVKGIENEMQAEIC